MTDRLISEAAVVALVNGKIDALRDKIERTGANPNIHARSADKIIDAALDKISALTTVIQGLKWIADAESLAAGGEFPIGPANPGGTVTLI